MPTGAPGELRVRGLPGVAGLAAGGATAYEFPVLDGPGQAGGGASCLCARDLPKSGVL